LPITLPLSSDAVAKISTESRSRGIRKIHLSCLPESVMRVAVPISAGSVIPVPVGQDQISTLLRFAPSTTKSGFAILKSYNCPAFFPSRICSVRAWLAGAEKPKSGKAVMKMAQHRRINLKASRRGRTQLGDRSVERGSDELISTESGILSNRLYQFIRAAAVSVLESASVLWDNGSTRFVLFRSQLAKTCATTAIDAVEGQPGVQQQQRNT
jgi:hypothetical protein